MDSKNERVFALNPTAGASLGACTVPTTLSGVTESMQCSLDPGVNEDLAESALLQTAGAETRQDIGTTLAGNPRC